MLALKPETAVVAVAKPWATRLRKLTKPAMTQIAPGKWTPSELKVPPDVSLCHWRSNGDGTFQPIPVNERFTRLNRKLTDQLGLKGQYNTLLRLAHAGFLEVVFIAPHCALINLDSLFNHIRRCAEDREFWVEGGKNRKLYMQSMF